MLYGTGVADPPLHGDEGIVQEAYENYIACKEWQSVEDERTREDIKFANGDERNTWQWPTNVYQSRTGEDSDGVCLTINNTRVHNDLIINQMSKSNFGVKIRPSGGGATYESAKIMQGLINRIKDISQFTAQRRKVTEQQVDGGIGYMLIETAYVSERSFDQDIFLRAARDPTAVYLDPWIREPDGRDANFGLAFERMSRKRFKRQYPKYDNFNIGSHPLTSTFTEWISDKEIMLVKYFRKKESNDTLISYKDASGGEVEKLASEIKEESGDDIYKALLEDIEEGRIDGRTRKVKNNKVQWFLIAGDAIIDRGDWAGKYIPIARCVGRELVIDGSLDRKGMTRSMIGAQRMLNYSASMAIEDVASQPKAVFIAPARAVEGQEQFKTMNIHRFPVILWNDVDDEAPTPETQRVEPPQAIARPQPSEGHMANMQAAERWGMMISGQFQAQMGENEPQAASSGKAITDRQQQGDIATYHFPEHQSDMLRYIGVQLLDLIPKIYDTERTLHITDDKNEKHLVQINPQQQDVMQELQRAAEQEEAIKVAFNPTLGEYDCISDPGPDYATQRQEAWNAMALIMQQSKDIAACCADLLFKYGDFPGADELMMRLQKEIKATKPYLFDDTVEPQMMQMQQQVQRLTALNAELMQKIADAKLIQRGREEKRDIEAYNAETNRMRAQIDAMSKLLLTPGQRAQMEHEIQQAGQQHVFNVIEQANQGNIDAMNSSNTNGSGGAQ